MEKSHSFNNVLICLPTYNEYLYVVDFVRALCSTLPGCKVIVIDDNSPDGTGRLADKLAQENELISVIHRTQKEGLGPAYTHGFGVALKEPDIDYIVQIDADFSHPVGLLPGMIAAMKDNDLIIGSRYVDGGGIRNWNWFRKVLSRFGSFYARMWLNVPVYDCTSGMKVWRRKLLQTLLAKPVTGGGYVFQVEMTYRAVLAYARIKEMPILFSERNNGESKMNAHIALEAFWRVPILRWVFRQK